MTFSEIVKNELTHVEGQKTCCMLGELAALTQACASMILKGGGRFQVRYTVENTALARHIFKLLKARLNISPAVQYQTSPRFGGRRILVLTVPENEARRLLIALQMLKEGERGDRFRGAPRSVMSKTCCRQAYLRGIFLGAGSMLNPEKGYYMEFVMPSPDRAKVLRSVLEKCDIPCQVTQRRGDEVISLSAGDGIASVLALTGAHRSLLRFEDIRITRASRGNVNRAVNCDHANLKKQLSAAGKQADLIGEYVDRLGFDSLPADMQEIAVARLSNPDVSLEELGKMLKTPLSKSGTNHKIQKLLSFIREKMQ